MPLNCTSLVQSGRCGSQASSGTVIKCHTCAAQSGSPAMTAITFAASICHADETCSVKIRLYNVTSEHDPASVLLILWL